MKQSNYNSDSQTPYFYYPKVGNKYCLVSYEEVNAVKNREGGELLFADLKMSFSKEEAEENYQKIEKFLAESMNEKEKKISSNYSEIKEKRVLGSSIEEKYWVSAVLDVWALNCVKSNFDVKVGHRIEEGYSVLMYRKKGNFMKEKVKSLLGNKKFEEFKIRVEDIKFRKGYSFKCGSYEYSLDNYCFKVKEGKSKLTPLIIGLRTGNTYGEEGEKEPEEFLINRNLT